MAQTHHRSNRCLTTDPFIPFNFPSTGITYAAFLKWELSKVVFAFFQTSCIFSSMQLRTYIITIAWGFIFCGLHIHPLFATYSTDGEQVCVISEKPACAKGSKCSTEAPVEEKEDCSNKGCNPFLPCMGSCCYLPENFFTYSLPEFVSKQKMSLVNDNRLVSNLSECWHPPEVNSWPPDNFYLIIFNSKKMKKIFLGMLAIALVASANSYASIGGKKKAKKKAKTEKKVTCDPKSCTKDDKCCDFTACKKEEKCLPVPGCSSNQ